MHCLHIIHFEPPQWWHDDLRSSHNIYLCRRSLPFTSPLDSIMPFLPAVNGWTTISFPSISITTRHTPNRTREYHGTCTSHSFSLPLVFSAFEYRKSRRSLDRNTIAKHEATCAASYYSPCHLPFLDGSKLYTPTVNNRHKIYFFGE